jgi:hypothetical protein
MPNFQLIDNGWNDVIEKASNADRSALRVVCPFIKLPSMKRLLAGDRPKVLQIITRFHLGEMCDGVNDTEAFRLLLKHGAKIRGIRNLHAKLYLFGDQRAIVTSANLTEAAMLRNHEFGFVTDDSRVIEPCRTYFDTLWSRAGKDLDLARLEKWEERIRRVLETGSRPSTKAGLPDEGTDVGFSTQDWGGAAGVEEAPQSFVKFFGEGDNRASAGIDVLDEVRRSGSHWACTYPTSKRPRQVEDNAVIFMGRLVGNPNDIMIYGRAVGMRHVEGRDEASAKDLKRRPWKVEWSNYIRVHDAQFVAGTLENGIRLSALMDELKFNSFVTTQANSRKGSGNTDPRKAFSQQPSVQLTKEAFAWLSVRLAEAFRMHGKLTDAQMETLDWPSGHSR